MSEGALSLENSVVVTRGTGRYYISKERATNLLILINSENCPRMIDINDNFIAASDIVGIVSAHQIEGMEKQKRGLWQCQHGNWQNKDDTTCKCRWGMSSNEKDEKPEPTPEQQERSQLLISLIRKKIFPKNVETLSNDELRKMLQ